MKLDQMDLSFAVRRIPRKLADLMTAPEWRAKIMVGGGFLRASVSNEKINDVDVFVQTKEDAKKLADILTGEKKYFESANAYTIRGLGLTVQIIHRWLFEKPEDVSDSFDFTICCAVIWYDAVWLSFCDDRFYVDLASKRLIYRCPARNEDAGGSMLRVLKYYQKGYRIPLDSLGAVVARMLQGLQVGDGDFGIPNSKGGTVKTGCAVANGKLDEGLVAKVVTGLLRAVDPLVDPTHEAHLPNSQTPPEPSEELPF